MSAAQNTEKEQSRSSGNQFSLGVGFSLIGQQNGFSVEIGASRSRSQMEGHSLVNHNSEVRATDTLTMNSDRDTTLQGAELYGERVVADVGRDLTISSQQDSAEYHSRSNSTGLNLSICVPPICAGASSASSAQGSMDVSSGRINNEYRAVVDQSGLFAGKGGFDIFVGGHTQLEGAVIASDAEAAKNRLSTDTLGWSDIENWAESSGSQYALSVSGGVGKSTDSDGVVATTGESQTGGYQGSSGGKPSMSMANFTQRVTSTTHSAVAEGDVLVRDNANQQQDVATLSRDTEHAHSVLENNFDRNAIRDKLEIQQQATSLGTQAMTAYAESQQNAAKQQARDEMAASGKLEGLSEAEIEQRVLASETFKAAESEYGVGSPFWTAGTSVSGLLAGVLGGNVQSGAAAGAAPVLAKLIKDASGDKEGARIALHTLASAVLAKAQGGNATAGAAGGFIAAASAKTFAQALYGKEAEELAPDEKMVILNLVSALGAAGGGLATGDTSGMVSAGNAARVEVENNALSDIIENKVSGVSQEEKYQNAQKQLVAAVEEFKAQHCAGMSADACSAKISEHRDELLKGAAGFGLDFVPVVGDIKGFAEAQSAIDYLGAMAGLIPVAGDAAGKAIKAAETALKKGDVAEASKLINKASDEISGYLPSPGHVSLPNSGVGSNAAFSVTNAQLGKKLGKHVEDFGGNASNAADRQRVLDIINDIGSNPDKVVAGKFAGQGVGNGASRGDVFFRIKGNDVVVTKPDGSFVTILKDGVNNTSVKNALKGDPK
ncbi:hemagglutinin repeat-containing protein [Lonsdalea quercina]|uniref:hemagglutinin repeat-containing protein n=1 Tax=Lonsdalea quercina TaxID=71657 RepID=UPI003975FEE2